MQYYTYEKTLYIMCQLRIKMYNNIQKMFKEEGNTR